MIEGIARDQRCDPGTAPNGPLAVSPDNTVALVGEPYDHAGNQPVQGGQTPMMNLGAPLRFPKNDLGIPPRSFVYSG